MLVTANIFQPLIDVFEAVLKFFHNTGGISWGFSIVLLTICVRAVMIPITLKQFRNMRALQALGPQMKEIQARYKEDKQRQQQEMMRFYKENNVNPLASCLPMVLQLPVFISLFYMLRKNLRPDICPNRQPHHYLNGHYVLNAGAVTKPCGPHGHAGFLFIHDLTNKATGATLAVLIVLYVGTQLASTMLMSAPNMDQNQRRIMMFMPLIFVLFILGFPSGVIVYWITTNTWTILQQAVIRRGVTPTPPVAAAAGAGGAVAIAPRGAPAATQNGSRGDARNGGGSGDAAAGRGIGGTLRARLSGQSAAPATVPDAPARRGAAPPPPSPRKKKKRSGRRR